MQEVSFRYYKRYLKIKLELQTIEKELAVLKLKQDRLAYVGCREVNAVDYSVEKNGNSATDDINEYYKKFVEVVKNIRELEEESAVLEEAKRDMEKMFREYSKKCTDPEMQVFIEFYVLGKHLSEIYIPKPNSCEYYSIRQIKRIHGNLKKKIYKD